MTIKPALGFDRNKASEELQRRGYSRSAVQNTALLDALAECIVNAPDHTLEGRDWIGNPDGTLVYWQAEAEEARAKLAPIEVLLDKAVGALRRKGDGEQLWTDAAEACIAVEDALNVLRGDA